MHHAYHITPVVSVGFEQNAYVVWIDGANEAIVFDPGFDSDAIVAQLRTRKLDPVAIVNTHGHADHIAGNGALLEEYPGLPIITGRREAPLLTDPMLNLSGGFGMPLTSPPATRLLDDGERVELAGLEFLVREIGGHSPGGLVFVSQNAEPRFAIVGDVIFHGSIGRTDFPGGSFKSLAEGIRDRLYTLPDETTLYPGHGPATSVGDEKRNNPFVRP